MGTLDQGTQTIIWDYKYPAKGSDFSKSWKHTFKPGVYYGGTITADGSNNAVIAPLTVFIEADSIYCVKISTSSPVTIAIDDNTTKIIYVTFSWADNVYNYMDFLTANSLSEVPSNGVILGTVTKTNGILSAPDYTSKTWGTYDHTTGYYKKIQTDQQIISAVPNGTAPFQVASTTLVANLNADMVDGAHVSTTATANTVILRDAYGRSQIRIPISAPANPQSGDIWLG